MSGNIIWTGSGEQAFEFYSVSGIQSFYIWMIRLFGSSGCISGKCRKTAGKSQYPWKQAAATGIYLAVFMIAAEKLVYRYFIMVGSHADVGKKLL